MRFCFLNFLALSLCSATSTESTVVAGQSWIHELVSHSVQLLLISNPEIEQIGTNSFKSAVLLKPNEHSNSGSAIDRRFALPASQIEQQFRIDPDNWNAATQTACYKTLEKLGGIASNPSGMAMCYNVPYYGNDTGIFQADLRLYRIMAPTGEWADIPPQEISVGVRFQAASISASTASTKRSLHGRIMKREVNPQILQVLSLVAQLNSNVLIKIPSSVELQSFLTPFVTLSATTRAGEALQTTMSRDEACFINGVLADPTRTWFDWPKSKLRASPVSLYVVLAWMSLLAAVKLLALSARFQARKQYRILSARQQDYDGIVLMDL